MTYSTTKLMSFQDEYLLSAITLCARRYTGCSWYNIDEVSRRRTRKTKICTNFYKSI